MRSIHFDVQGLADVLDLLLRLDCLSALFYLFAADISVQFGGLPAGTLALMRGTAWAFAVCFAVITFVSWRISLYSPYRFLNCDLRVLTAAAWLSAKTG